MPRVHFDLEGVDERALRGARLNDGRIIFHSDLNNFYASVECLLNPSLRNLPVAVCGSCEKRHGIVLAKNNIAKGYGVKTAEVIWQARRKCPGLVTVEADYGRYEKYSRLVRKIYEDYTDRIEPFGQDEAWLDMSGDREIRSFYEARLFADKLRERIFVELGLTVSVGVSYNKVFAKLASDYKKPNATTVFSPLQYRDIIANLPVGDLLFVGKSTEQRLESLGIHTIGQIAAVDERLFTSVFGKCGLTLLRNARGEDTSEVSSGDDEEIKSIGHSTTPPRDLESLSEVRTVCVSLCDRVAQRLRHHGMRCTVVQVSVRSSALVTVERQITVSFPTDETLKIVEVAMSLFRELCCFEKGVRSIGVRTSGLVPVNAPVQLSIFDEQDADGEKKARLEQTIDGIRGRFGRASIQRAVVMNKL